jgi:tRNA A37 threonylcarbamoyladenosine dehydratase
MSHQLINLSPDLKRLRDEGYEVFILGNHLLISSIPYVSKDGAIKTGTLVSELTLAGQRAAKPSTHVAYFIGEYPFHANGKEISHIKHSSRDSKLRNGITINHSFSNKVKGKDDADYYQKMTRYIDILSNEAASIDSAVTPKTFRVIESPTEESVFNYPDTNSSRAAIDTITDKLRGLKIGIVGVGGTGSYILDLISKAPVAEIHLFDGDSFYVHNAYRAPGAPSIEELNDTSSKVQYFFSIYSKMHRHIFPHETFLNSENIHMLEGLDFVFLCMDAPRIKRIVIEKLEEVGIDFIDVGMGLTTVDQSIIGSIAVTTSTKEKRNHVRDNSRITFVEDEEEALYNQNIQIAELNALNATLAVIKWKKLYGFYQDLEKEHFTVYSLNDHSFLNDDHEA